MSNSYQSTSRWQRGSVDMEVHSNALGGGIVAGYEDLFRVYNEGWWFVAHDNFHAITWRYDLLDRSPGDTDVKTGATMESRVLARRWKHELSLVLFHLV